MEEFHQPQPPDSVNSIEKAIQKIRFEKVEHLYIFKNGKQKRHFIGTENEVIIESKYLIDVKDATIVHNHPRGSSFSLEDFFAVVKYNVKKLILVTTNYTFILKRDNEFWKIKFDAEFESIFYSSSLIAEDMLNKEVSKNEIELLDKEIDKMHYIWVTIFNYYGISYKKNRL